MYIYIYIYERNPTHPTIIVLPETTIAIHIHVHVCLHVEAAHFVPSFERRLAPLEQEASDVPHPPLFPHTTPNIHTLTIHSITIHTLTIVIEKFPKTRKVLFDWRRFTISSWALDG